MRKHLRDNLARFFYDSARVSFAVMVIGVLVRKPLPLDELTAGVVFTLTFAGVGVIMDLLEVES